MKKFSFACVLAAIFFSACAAPHLTPDTSHVTLETPTLPPPTETPVPTPTLHPQFLSLQTQLASSGETFTLNQNGEIEMWTKEQGMTIVPDIKVNPDGTMTFTHDGQEHQVDTQTLTIEGQTITFKDTDGKTWVFDGERFLETFTLDELAKMSSEEKIANAPTIEGYTPFRSAERFVLYENIEGARDTAYDLTTAQQVTIPEYPICKPEKFYDCEIPQEDLMNGKYWLWLNTLDVAFDPEKIKWDVPIVVETGQYGWRNITVIYHDSGYKAPVDFPNPATAPFARAVTAGVVIYNENGVKSFGILRPIAFFERQTREVNWVVVLDSYVYRFKDLYPTNPKHNWSLNTWQYHYNVTPLMNNFYSANTGLPDPVLKHTYDTFPDIEERFLRFAAGDMSALSAPGLVVQTASDTRSSGNTYK